MSSGNAAALAELAALRADAALMRVSLSGVQARQQLQLLTELQDWAGRYNLTAIKARAAMITHHTLDSLSAANFLLGSNIADMGTGAGFPGLPLAIACPDRRFTLMDSTAKKLRFVVHARELLGLQNVEVLHAHLPMRQIGGQFDTVLARAVAPLAELANMARPLLASGARLVALKGRRPDAELAALPAGWKLLECTPLTVPGLNAQRHVVVLARSAARLPVQ
jgi:16S rRNA (guanine527-N7)-methyltransferase